MKNNNNAPAAESGEYMYVEDYECFKDCDVTAPLANAEVVPVHLKWRGRPLLYQHQYQLCSAQTTLEDIIEDDSECESDLHNHSDDFVSASFPKRLFLYRLWSRECIVVVKRNYYY